MKKLLLLLALIPCIYMKAGEFNAILPKAQTPSSVINHFSIRLMRTVIKDTMFYRKNVVVSPLSAAFTLSILNDGAEGRTRAEIDSVLGCNNDALDTMLHGMNEKLNAMDLYRDSLGGKSMPVDTLAQVMMSNCVIINNLYPLKKDYQEKIDHIYSAFIDNMDFNSPRTKLFINDWCSKRTKGMIPEIRDEINGDDKMYALNTLYFHGMWKNPFNKEDTKTYPFKKSNRHSVKIEMMNNLDTYLYSRNSLFSSVNMKYGTGRYSLILLLPNKGRSADELLDSLNECSWQRNLEKMTPRLVRLKLPKFTIHTSLDLSSPLKSMGMASIFDENIANFNHISDKSLSVSLLMQKVRIDVNEKETHSAAVSIAGRMGGFGGHAGKTKYIKFYATHPFVYAIVENATNTILFIGKYEGGKE